MSRYCVYKHTTPDGKVYIGITRKSNPNRRWKNGYGYRESNPKFWQEICNFGWVNIQHEIISVGLNKADAEEMEMRLINDAKAESKTILNITDGGPGSLGRKCSHETRQKIGQANTGHQMSQAEKDRRSTLFTGKGNPMYGRTGDKSPRHGVIGEQHPLYGKTGNECQNSKPVINITTGEIFVSATEAANCFNLDISSLCSCCRGKRKTCGGYVWKYYENEATG